MTIAQFIVAYSVCWWLVLFMMLPHKADPVANPEQGHARSAPENPGLKRKFIFTSLLAILPTLLIYFVATNARAEDAIYHVGGGCHKSTKYIPSADLSTKDGYGTGDKQVKPADLGGSQKLIDTDSIDIPLQIPSQKYIDRAAQAAHQPPHSPTSINGRNVDLSESFIQPGKLTVKKDGETLLNGKSISNNDLDSGDCDEGK